jgi:hypothetical protein
MRLSKYVFKVNRIFHISIWINCYRISEGLLYDNIRSTEQTGLKSIVLGLHWKGSSFESLPGHELIFYSFP